MFCGILNGYLHEPTPANMADVFSKQKRSWVMSRIRAKDTQPEIAVRSFLHREGLRFRLHVWDLPGTPDIVLPKHRTVVFVHGCFWHDHICMQGRKPRDNAPYWRQKLARNVQRDKENLKALRAQGWRTVVVWACEIRKLGRLRRKFQALLNKRKKR